MKYAALLFVLIFANLFYQSACAQTSADMQNFSAWLYKDKSKARIYKSAQENTSAVELVFSNIFVFYKEFISSQDGNICSFYPSCSEYGLQSIKKKGLVLGLMNGFDRLTRCNGLDREKYDRHPRSRKLHDPVE